MAKRSVFKNIVFPTPSDDETFRPAGARPIASRMTGDEAEFIRPASTTYDLSGRYQPRPVEQVADEVVSNFLEGETSDPANRFGLYDGEVDRRHTQLNDFLADKDDAYIGGDEREYRPAFVESQSGNAGAYAFTQRGDNVQPPVRLCPGWV